MAGLTYKPWRRRAVRRICASSLPPSKNSWYDAGVLQHVATWVQQFIADAGYVGLFVMIFLESTLVPIPSLLVMPFAGFMAAQGHFSLPVILVINSAGAVAGSAFSYWVGMRGGTRLLETYGKYFFIKPADIARTEAFFAKHGVWTILIARFMPVIRHLISIPAGVARMRLSIFVTQTFIGATIWGGGLMIVGYVLGSRWQEVAMIAKKFDLAIAISTVLVIVAVAVRFYLKRRKAALAATKPA